MKSENIRAAIDAAWGAAMLGLLAVMLRDPVTAFLRERRREIEQRTEAVNAKAREFEARAGFARHERDRLIAEEFNVESAVRDA